VTRIVDGDTIEVLIDGSQYKLRYIGIDTPESVDPRRPVECFGEEASDRNRNLVGGKTVGLEKDVSDTDGFGRLLRYVWLGSEMVNATLVRDGYAQAATYPPDVKHADVFASLQAEARQAGRGLWGAACGSVTPSPMLAPMASGCIIKGNISFRTGEKIYHVPGGEYYDETVIDTAAGERWFCTEAEAVAAGWRRSMR
jgi:micrococcal nuclease